MAVSDGFVVPGFRAAGIASGLKKTGQLDLALMVADGPCSAAGVFTRNLVQAAPVVLSRRRVASGTATAILANSGGANACVGRAGMEAAAKATGFAAEALGIEADRVLAASTGVIGLPLDTSAIEGALPELMGRLRADGFRQAAEAIMTTDTAPKLSFTGGEVDGAEVTVGGLCKGAGMIRPDMATMLAFLFTDAAVEPGYLQRCLSRAAEVSFNRITVDGDTSTNDTVFLLASGLAGNAVLGSDDDAGAARFGEMVATVCRDLARMIVKDGEGATKLVTVEVTGAGTDDQARLAAFTVAQSPLVKTALFGEDANWGRILGALGRSGAEFDPEGAKVYFDDVLVYSDGAGVADVEEPATAVMRRPEFVIRVDLGAGEGGRFEVLTCDLSVEYIRINADYRS